MLQALLLVGVLSCLAVIANAECILVTGRLICDRKPQAVAGVTIYMWDFETHDLFNWAARGEDTLMASNTTDAYGNFFLSGCTLDMDLGMGHDPPDPYFRFEHSCNDRPQLYERWVETPNFTPGFINTRNVHLDGAPDYTLDTSLHQWMGNP